MSIRRLPVHVFLLHVKCLEWHEVTENVLLNILEFFVGIPPRNLSPQPSWESV